MLNKRMLIAILVLLAIMIGSVYLMVSGKWSKDYIPPNITAKMKPVTLRYWRVFDGEDDFKEIFDAYHAKHPNITIEYRKLRTEEYEQALLEAFAIDKGPDIFSIHNTWTRKYQTMGLLEPMVKETNMVFPVLKGSIKKEVFYEIINKKMMTPKQLKSAYIDTVYDDVVISTMKEDGKTTEENVYALPLGVDTLVLYYNKDLFNNAGIANPPEFWNKEFQQDVKKLTKQNNKGEIIQSGVGMGGTDNVERAPDILSVLMMQNGTEMMIGDKVTFNLSPKNFEDYNPGLEALRFYSDFANPAKEVYAWNDTLDNSLELFIAGKLAMMFGYAYMQPTIDTRAPGLNYSIVKLPQIEGNTKSTNFANYWVETVSSRTKYKEEAWDFVSFMAAKDQVKKYLDKVKKPTALRSYITEQSAQEDMKMFVDQILTAKSWYHGNDSLATDAIIKDMVKQAVIGQIDLSDLLSSAAQKVQQTVTPK